MFKPAIYHTSLSCTSGVATSGCSYYSCFFSIGDWSGFTNSLQYSIIVNPSEVTELNKVSGKFISKESQIFISYGGGAVARSRCVADLSWYHGSKACYRCTNSSGVHFAGTYDSQGALSLFLPLFVYSYGVLLHNSVRARSLLCLCPTCRLICTFLIVFCDRSKLHTGDRSH